MGGRRGGGRRGSGGGGGAGLNSSSSASGSDVDGADDDNNDNRSSNESKGSDEDDEKDETSFNKGSKSNPATSNASSSSSSSSSVADWAQHVPLRLNDRERHLLTVLEQTLHVSEYTDHVDVAASNTGYMGGGAGMGFGGGGGGMGLYGNGGAGRRGGAKARRILDGILEVCHIAVGLATASGLAVVSTTTTTTTSSGANGDDKNPHNNNDSQEVEDATATTTATTTTAAVPYATREPSENAALFRSMFEVGRRNKVLNPSSMRTTYGKLMYLLQDAQNPTVAKSLGFRLHKPLLLVGPFLKKHHAFNLLNDPRLECAIQYVADRDAHGNKLDRTTLEAMVAGKHRVTLELVEAYSTITHSESTLRPEDVRRVIESLADAVAYIESNVRPVQAMLQFLQHNFDRNHPHKGFSLALSGSSRSSALLSSTNSYYGRYGYGTSAYASGSNEGPTLSHSHPTQYMFVWQSLNLWCKVMRNMHKLWICADDDLLSTTSSYHLYNTGQGLNRVQNCPKVRAVMSSLLSQTQREAGAPWVGLSVIHLGDRDVPNALVFIDKYTQIPRFLTPIVQFVHALPELCSDPVLEKYVTAEFGSIDHLKLTVLSDYFKHGFDGSGDDGGSCIDGRLTSSWNWTSRIAKKRYYHAFMMSGFQGFDGDFR
jgi:Protein of unknown function (DUF2009)